MSTFQEMLIQAKARIRQVDSQAAAHLTHAGAILLDVRDKEEFAASHLPGAMHISRDRLAREISERIPATNTPIICYCTHGHRSAVATDALQQMGYTHVVSLAGGIAALTPPAPDTPKG